MCRFLVVVECRSFVDERELKQRPPPRRASICLPTRLPMQQVDDSTRLDDGRRVVCSHCRRSRRGRRVETRQHSRLLDYVAAR